MSHRDFYPRWIDLPTGHKMIVHTHQQHSAMLGQEFDECANPVAPPIVPEEPTAAPVVIPFPAPAAEPPAEEEFPEPFYPPAAEIQPDAFADDPLGIFEPGPAEEEAPVGAATPDKPAKRRGKNRE